MDKQNGLYTYNGIYYSDIKRNEILTYTTTQMNPENMLLNEISQTQKDKYYMIPLI